MFSKADVLGTKEYNCVHSRGNALLNMHDVPSTISQEWQKHCYVTYSQNKQNDLSSYLSPVNEHPDERRDNDDGQRQSA